MVIIKKKPLILVGVLISVRENDLVIREKSIMSFYVCSMWSSSQIGVAHTFPITLLSRVLTGDDTSPGYNAGLLNVVLILTG